MATDNLEQNEYDEPYLCRDVQFAISSLAFGAVMVLAAPITCVLSAQIWAHADRTSQIVLTFAWLARISVGFAALAVGLGITFGAVALRHARRNFRPLGLALGSLSLNLIAAILWTLTAIALLSTTESLLRWFGR